MDEAGDLREFMRELMLRFDRKTDAWERRAERTHQETMARFAKLDERTDELLSESRAQSQALLRVIDRLDNGGGASPA